jgi:hypothetical protein
MANANDTFTEASDTSLVSHTSDSGHTWSKHVGNVLTVLASGDYLYNASPSNISRYMCSVTPASAEYDVQADVVSTINWCAGVSGRIVTADSDEYWCEYENSLWKLKKRDAGTDTTLATYSGDSPNGTTRTVKLEIRDATKKVYVGGVERISSADNALTAAGQPGIYFDGNSTGTQLDNWSSTDYSGGGGTTATTAADTDGTSTATASSASTTAVPASSAGTASATATSATTATAVLNATGSATATGAAASTASAAASSAGVSTATAVGESTSEGAGAGSAAGTSTATAAGAATATTDSYAAGTATAAARTSSTGGEVAGHSHSPKGRAQAAKARKKQAALQIKQQIARDNEDLQAIKAAVRTYLEHLYSDAA